MAAAMVDGLIAARTAPASITCLGGAGRSAATLAARTGITLAPSAQPQSGTFRARVDLPDDAARLAPGTYAKVGFVTGESRRTLVPRTAVVERSELRAVYVVGADGRVVLRQVRLGQPAGDRIEVIAGLASGEKVATDPAAAAIAARGSMAARHGE